jgi:PAS domain S-box-containing protein
MSISLKHTPVAHILDGISHFAGIYDTAPCGFTLVNHQALQLFGCGDLPHLNQHFCELDIRLDQLSESKECALRTTSGALFWAKIESSTFIHEGRSFYLIQISDIAGQKQKEDLARANNERFEAIFRHASMGMLMVDKQGVIMLSNRFNNVMFGYDEGELIGQRLEVLMPVEIRKRHEQHYQRYQAEPKSRPMGVCMDLKAQRKDGTTLAVEVSLGYFSVDDQLFNIAFITDVTNQKRASEELIAKSREVQILNENLEKEVVKRTNALVETLKNLEKSRADLELALSRERELGELKSRFVSMASHEFRTPLTAIASAASLIEKYTETEQQPKREMHVKRIQKAVNNLTDILEEFLSAGELEEQKRQAKYTDFDLPELIQECLTDLQNTLKPQQSIRVQHTGPARVHSDRSLLRKIFINLCGNASKFSPEGSVIEIISQSDTKLSLWVKDNGIGISPEDQKHLFERFFRGSNVTNIRGTGLGLHIVAQYVKLLRGRISVESQLNQGTTFHIRFDPR